MIFQNDWFTIKWMPWQMTRPFPFRNKIPNHTSCYYCRALQMFWNRLGQSSSISSSRIVSVMFDWMRALKNEIFIVKLRFSFQIFRKNENQKPYLAATTTEVWMCVHLSCLPNAGCPRIYHITIAAVAF